MEKNTPLEALKELRYQMDDEIINYRRRTGNINHLTGVFMSRETFDILKQADENCFTLCPYSYWQKTFNTPPIESSITGSFRCGYVMINDRLAKGKIAMRHYKESKRNV